MTDKDAWFPEGYVAPKDVSSFMSLEDGDNTFRILSKPVFGFEYWNTENKPVRSRTEWLETPSDIKLDKDGDPTSIKYFWAFLVYNYNEECVQSFEITQKTIMKALTALIENPKWGNPEKYDITINKTGKELTTKYSVVPNPHSEVTPEVLTELANTKIDLDKLFS